MPCNRYGYLGSLLVCALVLSLLPPGRAAGQQAIDAPPEKARSRAASSAKASDGNTLVALGARLAAQGVPDKAIPACANCHGASGEGMSASGFPRLAGQSPAYLVRQIDSFAQDSRSHPVMSPIARVMTMEQNMASAAYYSALVPDPAVPAGESASAAASGLAPAAGGSGEDRVQQRGRRLASVGDEALQIQACANCHGSGGMGEPPGYPYLAGQHASYLVNVLTQWKTGQRTNDPGGQMQAIASLLSDTDIAALAAYYAALPPPSRRFPTMNSFGSLPARNSPSGRGGPAAVQAQGVDSGAGAPVNGAGQGRAGADGATNANAGSADLPAHRRR